MAGAQYIWIADRTAEQQSIAFGDAMLCDGSFREVDMSNNLRDCAATERSGFKIRILV